VHKAFVVSYLVARLVGIAADSLGYDAGSRLLVFVHRIPPGLVLPRLPATIP
jgi:hypothetical protein